jgi:hypothetical protein
MTILISNSMISSPIWKKNTCEFYKDVKLHTFLGLVPIRSSLKNSCMHTITYAFIIREFKLRVSGNGKRQVRTFLAKFPLNVFVSYFLSCVERIVMHCSFKTTSSFTLYCLIPYVFLCLAFAV